MIGKIALIVLISTFALSSAIDVTLKRQTWAPSDFDAFSPRMFNTRHGIIGRAIQRDILSQNHEYVRISTHHANYTVFSRNFDTICSANDFYMRERIHYHSHYDTLVYYCVGNNSLLLLSTETFAVLGVIPTTNTVRFEEVQLLHDNNTLYVLGTDQPSNPKQASVLIGFDLLGKKVTNMVTLNQGFMTNEHVTAFTIFNNSGHFVTSQRNLVQMTNRIFSFNLTNGNYSLNYIRNNTYTSVAYPLTHIHIYSQYIVTNDFESLTILHRSNGSIYRKLPNLERIYVGFVEFTYDLAYVPQTFSDHLFVSFGRDEISQFTFNGTNITQRYHLDVRDFYIANGGWENHDLIMIQSRFELFGIWDLHNFTTIFQSFMRFETWYSTDTTYAAKLEGALVIFNSTNHAFAYTPIHQFHWHHDEASNKIYFLNNSNGVCDLVNTDLVTGKTLRNGTLYNFHCNSSIAQLKGDFTSGVVVLRPNEGNRTHYAYRVESQYYTMDWYVANNTRGFLTVPDSTGLTWYYIWSAYNSTQVNVTLYGWDTNTHNFYTKDTYVLNNISFEYAQTILDGQGVIIFGRSLYVHFVNLNTRTVTNVTIPHETTIMTQFTDKSNNPYYVFSALRHDPNMPFYYVDSTFKRQELPNSVYAWGAAAAGKCTYWVVEDAFLTLANFGLMPIKFYSVCGNGNGKSNISNISI